MILDVKGRHLNVCGSRSTGYSDCAKGTGFVCMLLPGHSGDHKAFGLWPEDPPRLVAQWRSQIDGGLRTFQNLGEAPAYTLQVDSERGGAA